MDVYRPLLVRVDLSRLAAAQARTGMSPLELYIRAGLRQAEVVHLAQGQPVSLRLVYALADLLDIGANDLLGDKPDHR
jgi:hypothetical protein